MRGDPRNAGDWLRIAREDLERGKKRLAENDLEDALFHLEQSAEKAMKGALISLGWKLAKTHVLPELLDELADRQVDCSFFRPTAVLLTTEYLAGRYPGAADPLPVKTEVERALQDSIRLVEELEKKTLPLSSSASVPANRKGTSKY